MYVCVCVCVWGGGGGRQGGGGVWGVKADGGGGSHFRILHVVV